ncbi:hypothetical protein J25TS5_37240 [Paenibacillus faecis]|uniref:hypothetical protein n=1 Tax=Paenibacillus faecis TaxID=862114 RepID=UPI001B17F474|nr:hypothetical protein [Paenibacillus faecis]GIO86792.1 hypothetical protein J25TS5_37240 [Paenibacillus faecis]
MGNTIIKQDVITFRDLGFGKKLSDKYEVNYEISLSHEEFREVMEDAYNTFVCETKEDDEVTNYSDSIGLYEIGYPDFNDSFINHKELLTELIKDYINVCLKNAQVNVVKNTGSMRLILLSRLSCVLIMLLFLVKR